MFDCSDSNEIKCVFKFDLPSSESTEKFPTQNSIIFKTQNSIYFWNRQEKQFTKKLNISDDIINTDSEKDISISAFQIIEFLKEDKYFVAFTQIKKGTHENIKNKANFRDNIYVSMLQLFCTESFKCLKIFMLPSSTLLSSSMIRNENYFACALKIVNPDKYNFENAVDRNCPAYYDPTGFDYKLNVYKIVETDESFLNASKKSISEVVDKDWCKLVDSIDLDEKQDRLRSVSMKSLANGKMAISTEISCNAFFKIFSIE